jgi:malonyl-CoA decarboxylase
VARFHLGNGAQVHRLHAQADLSDKGMRQSHGVMVNYLYDLDNLARNHEQFASSGQVAASAEIRSLSADWKSPTDRTPRHGKPAI